MEDCIFCKIIEKEVSAKIYRETDNILAFEDAFKIAPVHVLIIPKKHIESMNDIQDNQSEIISEMFLIARDLAKELKIDESGYKLLIRTGLHGGQEVPHVHLHLIGGVPLSEDIRPI
ncbi:MAG: histidine triad nucleotide-binding protein [Candidatus Moranbacteria bacterium]|nr:histidine triad nucleotide-binding protein [Candidatus Moranbacteria bacterium]